MKEAEDAARKESQILGAAKPLIFGVTVLTSLSPTELKTAGITGGAFAQVRRLALLARKAGLDGVVSSGAEVKTVRETCGKSFLIAVPGIRPGKGARHDDQKRIMTPEKALSLGADYLIVGRPILESKDRAGEAEKMLKGIG
jgi:orotidine-5'-phosphate decarboxylase